MSGLVVRPVIYHNTLSLHMKDIIPPFAFVLRRLHVFIGLLLDAIHCIGRTRFGRVFEDRVRPHLQGEANKPTARVILFHRLDRVSKDILVTKKDVRDHTPLYSLRGRSDNLLPGRADPFDAAFKIEIHDGIQSLFRRFLQVFPFLPHVVAHRPSHFRVDVPSLLS